MTVHTADPTSETIEDFDSMFRHEDLWAVVVWNDDVTTFDTVIRAFMEILNHSRDRSEQLAWRIHRTGKAVVAIRPKDEAERVVTQLHARKIQASLDRA